jgi:hypothetical protein
MHGVDTAHTYVLAKTKAIANCDLPDMESDGWSATSAGWPRNGTSYLPVADFLASLA